MFMNYIGHIVTCIILTLPNKLTEHINRNTSKSQVTRIITTTFLKYKCVFNDMHVQCNTNKFFKKIFLCFVSFNIGRQ